MAERSSANRDPVSGVPGAHPVGTGIGAAAGGIAAGAAAGSLAAGPVGTMVGAAAGAVAGGLAGRAVAESIDVRATRQPASQTKPFEMLDLAQRIQEARANAQQAKKG